MLLPNSLFSTRWVPITSLSSTDISKVYDEAYRVWKAPGWNPKVVSLEVGDGSMIMFDLAMEPEKKWLPCIYKVHILKYEDHKFLSTLPPNAPRVVKSLYKKEVRLRHLRAKESWGYLEDISKAEEAWRKYLCAQH